MPKLYGTPLSPFARKVLIALAEKEIQFDHDPVAHFALPEGYEKLHPLRKVPVFVTDQDQAIPDSTVILNYLDRVHPEPRLIPEDPIAASRALFLEEYMDSDVSPAIATLFIEKLAAPLVMNRPTNEEKVNRAWNDKLPPLLTYINEVVGDHDFLVDDTFSVADIAFASSYCNLKHTGLEIDQEQYPNLRRYADQIIQRPTVAQLYQAEVAQFGGVAPDEANNL